MRTLREWVWLMVLLAALAASVGYSLATPVFDAPALARILCFILMGLAGFLLVFCMPASDGRRQVFYWIWLPSILLRLAIFPTAPSDDVARYLWEGKLVAQGVSPYDAPAEDARYESYRDVQWEKMNHKDQATAYPPLALLGFAGVSLLSYTPMVFKWAFLGADLLVIAGILKLLRRRGLSAAYVGFYAFNPLVLVAFAGEGHFDVWMLAALVWALCADDSGKRVRAIGLIALATGIKWITLPLLPCFLRGRWWGGLLVSLIVLGLPAVFFADSLPQLVEGLLRFGGTRSFNGPIYELMHLGLGWSRRLSTAIVLGLFVIIVLWRWLLGKRVGLDCHIYWVIGGLIVLSPTVHFWYLVWILPWVCLRPSFAWLSFSVSAGAYFFVWLNEANGLGWDLSLWQQMVFWSPFGIACLYELWSTRGRLLLPQNRESDGRSFSVVIPVRGVSAGLHRAVESVRRQTRSVEEIIIVDGLSSSQREVSSFELEVPVRVLHSELGRGQQIRCGLQAATTDWVIVLHDDACLHPASVDLLWRAVDSDRTLIGGAFGQRFEESSPGLMMVECLNDIRAMWTRTSFGDQVQYFHRETALSQHIMKAQPLMEDVEASWRLRECGGCRYLWLPAEVSGVKWLKTGWLHRVRQVLSLVARYRWARLWSASRAERMTQNLYKEYYSGD